MFTLVAGGAASGKSGCAEELILQAGTQPRFYVATMQIFDDEVPCAHVRTASHAARRQRLSDAGMSHGPVAAFGCRLRARFCWNASAI